MSRDKEIWPNETQIKTPEKELSEEEIANLSDTQFKTLVISMLKGMIEYGCKIEEKVKVMQSEIKKNIQRTNSEWKETGTQINNLEQREEINNQNRMKKQEFKKVRRGLGTSGTTLNVPISESLGCQKEKRKSKKLKAYLKK